jgi:hypothetical protein
MKYLPRRVIDVRQNVGRLSGAILCHDAEHSRRRFRDRAGSLDVLSGHGIASDWLDCVRARPASHGNDPAPASRSDSRNLMIERSIIHGMKSSSFDLNHARALHHLLEQANVTRAAHKLGITPAAASNALQRLRVDFGDPLLVRSGRTLARTFPGWTRRGDREVETQEVPGLALFAGSRVYSDSLTHGHRIPGRRGRRARPSRGATPCRGPGA